MTIIDKISSHVQLALLDSHGSHDWEHTKRVTKLAQHIAKIEQADQETITVAALLHDISRHLEDQQQGKICHATEGAKAARQLLTSYHVPLAAIDQICHCIATHRYRNDVAPQSLEAKVLFDADKLDSLGAVGIGRAFLFAGGIGAKLHNKDVALERTDPYTIDDTAYREYMVKLRFVKNRMLTQEGKRLAQERHEFMELFFKRLNQEVDGLL